MFFRFDILISMGGSHRFPFGRAGQFGRVVRSLPSRVLHKYSCSVLRTGRDNLLHSIYQNISRLILI